MGLFRAAVISLVVAAIFYTFSNTFVDLQPQAYRITTFDRLAGVLKENNKLNSGERLFEGEIFGPESLAVYEGIIYTGTSDGCITKIRGNDLTCLTRITRYFGKTQKRSRPLGMRFDSAGKLYVADGFLGLLSVDVNTGSVHPLLMTAEVVDGKPVTFPDDLSISSEGIIYFSDGSVKWDLDTVGLSVVEHENSGRVIQFDTKTNKSSVLVDGIYFPNGVHLSKSEESLLISEFSNHRILRHYLKGDKKGETEVFANVPGYPDNIRNSKNGYWVALVSYHNPHNAGLMERLNEHPFLRKLVIRFQQLVASLLLFSNQYWKSERLEDFANELHNGFNWILPPAIHGMAIEIDENGKLLQSVQSPDGSSGALSEVLEHDGFLYAGSFLNRFIVKMKIN